jgi:hypothetical protein
VVKRARAEIRAGVYTAGGLCAQRPVQPGMWWLEEAMDRCMGGNGKEHHGQDLAGVWVRQ